jgi:hypothetical protein
MRTEVRAKTAAQEDAPGVARTVVIDDVKFDGPTRMPDALRERVVAELKLRTFKSDSDWLEEIQSVSILGTWQDLGFFKVLPHRESADCKHGPYSSTCFANRSC